MEMLSRAGKRKLINLAWSDAAREAAAQARKNGGGKTQENPLQEQQRVAFRSSVMANKASGAAKDSGTSDDHETAFKANSAASLEHAKAAGQSRDAGNTADAEEHSAASKSFGKQANDHLAAAKFASHREIEAASPIGKLKTAASKIGGRVGGIFKKVGGGAGKAFNAVGKTLDAGIRGSGMIGR